MSTSTSTIYKFEYDCTKKCKFRGHGNMINSAITKRSIDDENLARYIAKCCRNFAQVIDSEGRSALHMASSTNRYFITEWLLNHGAAINAKDQESGSTALHRAIYYGCIDCAVLLLRYGANPEITDNDYLKPLQLVCKIRDIEPKIEVPINNELLVWGTNRNYNLGIEKEKDITNPQFIDYFRKNNICITSMAINLYHSLFLDSNSCLYGVGHGKGGRLGNGSEDILPSPKEINIPTLSKHNINSNRNTTDAEYITQMSCSKNHSLLLTNKSRVFSCGMNKHYQLGIETVHKLDILTQFEEITAFEMYDENNLKQVIAKDQYSLAAAANSLYIWGKNNGQFGYVTEEGDYSISPRILKMYGSANIHIVESSNTAIACHVGNLQPWITGAQILFFYNYKTKLLKFPFISNKVSAICLSEKRIDTNVANQPSTNIEMLILAQNEIFIWTEKFQAITRCLLPNLNIEKVLFKDDQLLLLSDGYVYQGKMIKNTSQLEGHKNNFTMKNVSILNNQNSSTLNTENNNYHFPLSSFDYNLYDKSNVYTSHIKIELKNLLHFDRVSNIFCDDDFQSFGVIQESSNKYYKVPNVMYDDDTYEKLLNNSNEYDQVHDIVIHVDTEKFYCHKFVIYTRSIGLMKIIKQSNEKDIYLNYENLTPKMFEIILKHIYINYYVNEEDFDEISHSLGPKKNAAMSIFLEFVEMFELDSLTLQIKNYIEGVTNCLEKPSEPLSYDSIKPTTLPELYDVTIKCKDDLEIKAHKCILVSRLDYFEVMFNNNWSEKKVVTLKTISYEHMYPVIEFLYTSDIENFREQNYSETFIYNIIIICDQFFVNNLRKICEVLISERISIKKCGDMLQFSHTYNCEFLKKCCLDFICQNLQRILIHKSLDDCEYNILKKISAHYRDTFKDEYNYRIITPYSSAINDENLLKFVQNFNVDLYYKMSEDYYTTTNKKSKKQKTINKLEKSKRDYEKQVIDSMNKLLLDDEINNSSKISSSSFSSSSTKKHNDNKNESTIIDNKKAWIKINQKKSMINSSIIAAKCNNILKEDKQQKQDSKPPKTNDEFINLNDLMKSKNSKVLEKKNDKDDENRIMNKNHLHNYNFGDILPRKIEKISQKQRKQLFLESKCTKLNSNASVNSINNHRNESNPWNLSSSSSKDDEDIERVTSFADVIKSPKSPTSKQFMLLPNRNSDNKCLPSTSVMALSLSSSSSPSPSSSTGAIPKKYLNSSSSESRKKSIHHQKKQNTSEFSKILEDEKRQKEYYEKLKNKPLVMTQIEETAINELENFYNIDNVFDENITIQRKSQPITMNFSVWRRK